MANVKISQLPSLSTMTDAAEIPVVSEGVTYQITGSNLTAYFGGGSKIVNGTSYANIASADGNLEININNNSWNYNTDGGTVFPTLTTQRGDNPSGTISGQTLLFGDATQEAVVSTSNGIEAFPNSQRLVINPGQGYNYGEGGDIYLWAGRGGDGSGSAGDIKIRGGQGGANTTGGSGGNGGYIRMEAGDAVGAGQPGYVQITGGWGADSGQGGNVTISAGDSNAVSGNVLLSSGGYTWTIGNDGKITLPYGASLNDTSGDSVAFGQNAGLTSQAQHAVAIGSSAGSLYQGEDSIAIGSAAGYESQGANSIAIGTLAGQSAQGNNSIILNATGVAINSTGANTFTVAPVRNDVANTGQVMFYNTASKEITYGNTVSVAGNITGGNVIMSGGNITGAIRVVTTPTALSSLTAVAGGRAFVNNGNLVASGNFGSQIGGGGSNIVPVWSNGTNWYVG